MAELERCSMCGHAPHRSPCLNMASDNDCACLGEDHEHDWSWWYMDMNPQIVEEFRYCRTCELREKRVPIRLSDLYDADFRATHPEHAALFARPIPHPLPGTPYADGIIGRRKPVVQRRYVDS